MSVAVPAVHISMERGKGIEVDGDVRVGFPAFRILFGPGFKSYIQIVIVDITVQDKSDLNAAQPDLWLFSSIECSICSYLYCFYEGIRQLLYRIPPNVMI